jgi:RNA polymerase sigma factor (sigma-70 family)
VLACRRPGSSAARRECPRRANGGLHPEPSGTWRCIHRCEYEQAPKRDIIDDAEAIARSLDGDLDAYAVLVARYTVRAHRTAYLLGAGDEADDVVQEALVKAFRQLSRFRIGEPFGPWLLRIVANETKNLNRSRRRRTALALRLSALEGAPAPAGGGAGPAGEALAKERRGVLLRMVDALPDKERRAVVCRYFLELSEAETAQVLGWPVGSVKSRTFRALTRLRRQGGGPDKTREASDD